MNDSWKQKKQEIGDLKREYNLNHSNNTRTIPTLHYHSSLLIYFSFLQKKKKKSNFNHVSHPNLKHANPRIRILFSYLSFCVFPWSIDQINRKRLHAQPPLNAVHHDMQAFTVPDYKSCMIQLVGHLFEVKVGILGHRQRKHKFNLRRLSKITFTFKKTSFDRPLHALAHLVVKNWQE